jgi:GMP synthase-like glutamine amidotransferase
VSRAGDLAARGNGAAPQRPALILQHGDWGPPGLLAEWLEARGIPYVIHRTYVGEPMPDPTRYAFIASLGSNRNPRDTDDPAVAAELVLLEAAIDHDVPVLGLCFGGQALAAALGAEIETAPTPELGWTVIETDDPALVPPGPWLEWHYDRFLLPPGATEIARTPHATQAFRHGRHLGVQFHPESTPEIVAEWAAADGERLQRLGLGDGRHLIAATGAERDAARAAAFQFFDGFLAIANDPAAPAAAVREG